MRDYLIETMYDKIRRRYEYAALRCNCQEKKKAKRTQKVSKDWPVNSWKLDCPRIEGCDESVPPTPVAALSRHPDPSTERGRARKPHHGKYGKDPALQAEIVSRRRTTKTCDSGRGVDAHCEEKEKKNSQAGEPRAPDGNRKGADPIAFEGNSQGKEPRTLKGNSQGGDPRTFQERGHKVEKLRIQEKRKEEKWKKRKKKKRKKEEGEEQEKELPEQLQGDHCEPCYDKKEGEWKRKRKGRQKGRGKQKKSNTSPKQDKPWEHVGSGSI